ncbi:hypothetical protein DY023_14655 [Microbacterium bovistercoris]|uniref:Histidine kinase n=1 Tax=Microbacterium bovistercoris TaxID=2293570 RepID=A0A371NSD2_9MICO|nr:hypothetical protein [Microbacterium bovistercoris]REJ04667.1 hypothetical protein DY023_14655 [Microbacterium bovistercoris]
MKRIDGRALGTWSLRLDAIYCALLGGAVALSASSIALVVAIPQPLIVAAGVAVVLWAGLVLWMLARLRICTALRTVMGVNMLAALLVALCAIAAGTLLAVVAVFAVAIDIAIFAASQALALRTLPTARTA